MVASDRESLAERRDLRLGLVGHDLGRVVGTASLFKIDPGNRHAEIGYGLAFEQQGSGLGLTVAKRLTELHDGELTIQSEIGVGTTVELKLPCVTAPG